jgi:Protein of unknown function (DUF1501)
MVANEALCLATPLPCTAAICNPAIRSPLPCPALSTHPPPVQWSFAVLSILGSSDSRRRHCDRIHRREWLKLGALGLGGLTLADLLRLESLAASETSSVNSKSAGRHKSVIMIYLCGGPPHQDMYDIKADAPREIRGEFVPIKTNVPGIEICEHLPQMAKIMDKLVPIRSMVGARDAHYSYQCMTGHHDINPPAGGWPHIGAAVTKFQGAVQPGIPPFVSLCYTTQHRPYNEPDAGFLGLGHNSFRPTGPSRDDMILQGIDLARLQDRHSLMQAIDQFRRETDASGKMEGMDVFSQRALGILTSSDLFNALDISKEDEATRQRYGAADLARAFGDGAPRTPQNFLIARRLVEAGVRFVTINYSFWDWHGSNFSQAKQELPIFDQALSALVEDLHQRGLSDDVAVVAWGEFGRSPQINKDAGRDHWPNVSAALLAGGGFRTGQVIGKTDRYGGQAVDRPVTFPEVFATLYHHLGIDLNSERLFDFRGQPQELVASGIKPLAELV